MDKTQYEDVLWRWFLERADVHYVYGWTEAGLDHRIRAHLMQCGIDHGRSTLPYVGSVSEFGGTDCGNDDIEAITTDTWACRCGEYANLGWRQQVNWDAQNSLAIRGARPLGEIMWQVIQTAEFLAGPQGPGELAARRRQIAHERADYMVRSSYVKCAERCCNEVVKAADDVHPWDLAQEAGGWTLMYGEDSIEANLKCPLDHDQYGRPVG